MTPSGIEPATFRFVVQHLNHCATAVPRGQAIIIAYSEHVFVALGIQHAMRLTVISGLTSSTIFQQIIT